MSKKKKIAVSVLAVCMTFIISTTASEKKEVSVTSQFQTGKVVIRIRQKNGTRFDNIVPGERVPMKTEIEGEGEACYVRIKIKTDGEKEIPMSCFEGRSDQWIEKKGYLYYKKPIPYHGSVLLYDTFSLPENWNEAEFSRNPEIHISLQADAIQSKNFTPDFQAESPWGKIEVKDTDETKNDYLFRQMVPKEGTCRVVLQGDKIVLRPDGFFENLGKLMPGDCITGKIQVANEYPSAKQLWMKIASDADEEFLKQLHLTIADEKGNFLYNDMLKKERENPFQYLHTYQANEKEQLVFSLSMPEETGNVYSEKRGNITWIFRGGAEDVSQKEDPVFPEEKVKTGDASPHLVFLLLLVISSVLIIFSLIFLRRKGKK